MKRDFACWRPHLAPGAVVAFDVAPDPSSGPWKVIDELVRAGELAPLRAVGKVRAFTHRRTRDVGSVDA